MAIKELLTAVLLAGPAAVSWAGPRASEVAGAFYPAAPKKLSALVRGQLKKAKTAPVDAIVALLVPHAGLEFSGPTAAKAYAALPAGAWDSVIVIGAAHYKELDYAALYPEAYSSSEGSTPYDEALARELVAASPFIRFDAVAHHKEHSIEVQLPYLRRVLPSAKLVALIMNTQDLEVARAVGQAIAKTVKGKRVLLIASSDQSHYPSGGDADAVDKTTLLALQTLDATYFWLTNRLLLNRGVKDLSVSYCGEGAVTSMLIAARALGAVRMEILSRCNSGDVVAERDYHHVVGYASALFLRNGAENGVPALTSEEKNDLLRLARQSIAAKLSGAQAAAVALSFRPRLNLPQAAFVTLWGKDQKLRGSGGGVSASESLSESVAHGAVSAAISDARFRPLSVADLKNAQIEISALSPLRAVSTVDAIAVGDGVFIENNGRVGVLLPADWKEFAKKEDFLGAVCAQKASLPRDCYKDSRSKLFVFSVDAFAEDFRSKK